MLGRYALYDEIAAGGMATVHIGRLNGPVGFSRTVAIKRLHPHLAKDPEFVTMFLDEARLAARVRHPNVVPTIDVVTAEGQLFVVMEYVQGESLAKLARATAGGRIPAAIGCAIVTNALYGLHAAHEATNEQGEALGLVHRDVSPQNILVGLDGVARVLDFGVAKAVGRVQTTRDGQLKGKLAYMAPEQVRAQPVTRRTDLYAAAIVLWEVLVGERLFTGDDEASVLASVLSGDVPKPSARVSALPPALDAVVLRGLSRNVDDRYATAREMARAIEKAIPVARTSEVADWVESIAGSALMERARQIAVIESDSASGNGSLSQRLLSDVQATEPEEAATIAPRGAFMKPPASEGDAGLVRSESSIVSVSNADVARIDEVRRRRRGVVVVAALLLVLGAITLVTIGIRSKGKDDSGAAVRSLGSIDGSAEVAPSAAPSSVSSPASVASAISPAPIETSAPTAPTRSVSRGRSRPSAPEAPAVHAAPSIAPAPPASSAPRPSSTCTPPYVVDAEGVKHYKRECL